MSLNPDGSIPLCRSCGRSAAQNTVKYDDWLAKIRENILSPQPEPNILREELNDATEALHTLDEEIAAVAATLETLKLRKRSIKSFISQGKGGHAPIRTLPPEVLLSIFSLVCERNVFAYSDDAARGASTIRISQTCHYWRMLCLDSPRLWTVLSIHPEYEYTLKEMVDDSYSIEDCERIRNGYQDDRPLFDLYLQRSKSCNLHVTIDSCSGDEQNPICEPDYDMAHSLLQKRSHSFETLTIDPFTLNQMWGLWLDGEFRYDLNEKLDRFPSLKQLTLRSGSEEPWSEDDVLELFSEAPITQLQLGDVRPQHYVLPWKSILSVGVQNGLIQDLRCLEEVASNISSLRIECLLFTESERVRLDQLLFPEVVSLAIEDWFQKLDCYLERLRCPKTEVLEVRGDGWVCTNKLGKLFDTRMGSVPLLHTLTLGDPEADVQSTIKILEPLKNIRSLHLDFLKSTGSYCKRSFTAEGVSGLFAMALQIDGDGFLPKLSELTVAAYNIIIDAHVVAFLESRRCSNVPHQLDRITFSRGNSNARLFIGYHSRDINAPPPKVVCFNRQILARLRALRTGGLHICINSDWSPLDDLACLE